MIDIVIPVRNSLDNVRNCIADLYANTPLLNRLIVVDDCSNEDTQQYLQGPEVLGRSPANLYVRTNSQKWFTRASNIGLRLVRTEKAVLLNSDTRPKEGWLEELLAVWKEFEDQGRKVGLVGSMWSFEEGRRYLEMTEPGYVTGHCWLVSMEAMREIAYHRGHANNYLDEIHQDAIHINSDKYGSYEMNRRGYATIYSFKSVVDHGGFGSWRGGPDLGMVFGLRITDQLKGEVG